METYQLKQTLWDDTDFDFMVWHDNTVWSLLPNPEDDEFLLDLDYIFEWVRPAEGETWFKFWLAPVTMVFQNVHDVTINLTSCQGAITIAELHREPEMAAGKVEYFRYRFECEQGEILLDATGFRMFVRRPPELRGLQFLSLSERGDVSFGRTSQEG